MDYRDLVRGLQEKLGNMTRNQWIGVGIGAFLLWSVLTSLPTPSDGMTDEETIAEVDRLARGAELAAAGEPPDARYAADPSIEAKKPEMCDILVDQVVDQETVFEINNVSVIPSTDELVTCSGDAITSHGDAKIEFGLMKTPQGRPLVTKRFP